MRRYLVGSALALVAIAAAGAAMAQQRPAAVYWVTADTQAGGVGGLSGLMSMMGGGQPSADVQRLLRLQLVSGRVADGASVADHLPPAGLRLGEKLPLVAPQQGRAGGDAGEGGAVTGRVLIYWGCGERVRAGQPMAIDLARPGGGAAGQSPGLGAGLGGFASAPAPGAGRTYAEWPNVRTGTRLPAGASLIGEHRVRGDATPEIAFSLGAGQDFMPPLALSGTSPDAAGVTPLNWGRVAGGQGYFVSVVGANDRGDTVIWTSSETPLLAGQVPDHLTSGELERLIARRAVLNAETTRCAIPAEVGEAAPAALLRVVAYGGEADFAHPPRTPAREPDYVVKVRYASIASAMLGLSDDADEEEVADADAEAAPSQPATGQGAGERARALFKRFGGFAP